MNRGKPSFVRIRCVELPAIFHHGGKRERLAARAGAHVDHLLAGLGGGEQCGKLRAFVLHLHYAFDEGRLGMDRRALGIGVERKAQTEGRPARGHGIEMGKRSADRLPFGFERVDPQIKRRPAGQRRAFGDALLAEHPCKIGIQPLRIIARDPGRSAREISRGKACALVRAQRGRRKAATVGTRGNRIAVELALEPQHPEDNRARALVAHDMGTRGPPPQRVVNKAGDRRTVGRTSEAVHKPPILERIACWASPRFDVGDDLNSRGKASAGRHQIPSRMRIMKITHMAMSTSAPTPKTGPRRLTSLSVMWM